MHSTTQAVVEGKATPGGAAGLIRKAKRATRRRYDAEDKTKTVLKGFRKEIPVSDLCRREGISTAIYYSCLKQFMEGGKARLRGNSLRGATRQEAEELRHENRQLKELAGEQTLELWVLKKG